MPDPDRLSELRRQRAAIAAHLNWLDGEIKREARLQPPATAAASSPQAPQPAPAPAPAPASPAPAASRPQAPRPLEAHNPSPALTADPDAVLEEWTEQSGGPGDQPVSKMGCWVIFATIAIVGIGGTVTLIYWIYG